MPDLDPAALAAAVRAACDPSCDYPACHCEHGNPVAVRAALLAYLSADPRAVEIERLTRERDLALVDLGRARMCVNCGKVMDADAVKPGDDLPECRDTTPGPTEGFAACQFDTTPQEAWQVWRDRWHAQHAEIAALRAQVERMREALEFYANPEIYKPHPHGPAFDRRDMSFKARAAIAAAKPGEGT